MLKKMFIKEGFSHNGERFVKGTIAGVEETAIERLASEGFIEDVPTALGLDVSCNTDLSDYVKKSEIEDLKGKDGIDGKDGKDGYPTKEQWEALVSEKTALESTVTTLNATVEDLVKKVDALVASKEEPASLGAKATTKTKAKKA